MCFVKSGRAAAVLVAVAAPAEAFGDHNFGRRCGAPFLERDGNHDSLLYIRNTGCCLGYLPAAAVLPVTLSAAGKRLFHNFGSRIDGVLRLFHLGGIKALRRPAGSVRRALRRGTGGLRRRVLAVAVLTAAEVHLRDLDLCIADSHDDAADAAVIPEAFLRLPGGIIGAAASGKRKHKRHRKYNKNNFLQHQ